MNVYYSATIDVFLQHDPDRILGELTRHYEFALEDLQKNAWSSQIEILKRNLNWLKDGHIVFEYPIPRMGKRVDTVILSGGIVFVLEFKVGDQTYALHAVDQVLDYALDLKNFHQQSHDKPIIPVVVATVAPAATNTIVSFEDRLYRPLKANQHNLGDILKQALQEVEGNHFDPCDWLHSIYKPTPTIIEAAQALYQGHSVKEISRSDAGAINLSLTSEAIFSIIDKARMEGQKVICFVTGVPGSGKTLAGLNIANQRLRSKDGDHAVFLSGNGPLVKVLREALARNEVANSGAESTRRSKKKALSEVSAFIQNIHHFRDEAVSINRPPTDRVVIFDEAQRAWTLDQTVAFMRKKRGVLDFSMSEPQFLISVMDRHPDWAVIICLVGGGQEINTGEAGLLEWFHAIRTNYPQWQVYASNNLSDHEYTRGQNLNEVVDPSQLHIEDKLHLAVSVRSYRSEKVAHLIKALLDNDLRSASELYLKIKNRYPIAVTRELECAKQWIRAKARGTERYGLLASSGGHRLRPVGVNVQAEIDVINWFLNDKADVRSSYYLEEVATEFDIQGLELDWACLAWDADLRYVSGDWEHHAFRGTKWQRVHDLVRKQYLKNAYRVLLTRARQGMVIVVPYGSDEDQTRNPAYYDGTYAYLKQIGIMEI